MLTWALQEHQTHQLHTLPAISGPLETDVDRPFQWTEYKQASRERHSNPPFPSRERDCDEPQQPFGPLAIASASRPSSLRFPLHDFKSYFTPLSGFFSSFVRTTCSLSVSCQYLALREIYLALCAALPSNATRRSHSSTAHVSRATRGFHPPWQCFPDTLRLGTRLTARLHATTPTL